ncbi:MAG TPA: N-acetyltransferase, partial [Methanothrix sp.]|nr:N-acetyltransferase [Methanothrix sp.]
MIIIREERPEDAEAIRRVNNEAFGQPAEAEVVDRLRESCKDLLSIVAVEGGEVVGHILFSPATIGGEGATHEVAGMGLAPMAVLPAWVTTPPRAAR